MIAVIVLIGLIIVAFVISLETAIVFYAWNLVISPIFHIQHLTFIQAFLFALFVSMIGGFFTRSSGKK